MAEMRTLEFASLSPASSMRQRVRYSMGDSPTVCLNLSVKVDRDMPERFASSPTSSDAPDRRASEVIAALIR